MFHQKMFALSLVFLLGNGSVFAQDNSVKLEELDGNWHLRNIDGKGARKARAILEFDSQKMAISGFDGCNKITGTLIAASDTNLSSKLTATKMACRKAIHVQASKALHETLAEGFTVVRATSNGVEGVLIKSQHHQLFFKKMGQEEPKEWFSFDLDLDLDYDFDFGSDSNQSDNNQSDTNQSH